MTPQAVYLTLVQKIGRDLALAIVELKLGYSENAQLEAIAHLLPEGWIVTQGVPAGRNGGPAL